jgi:DNA-binding MltR family transcriptional regulator
METPLDPTNEMKAEIYETLAIINRSFEQIISALYKLEKRVDLGEDYAYNQEIIAGDLWARINTHALGSIAKRELEDKNHFSRMRANLDKRRSR